MWLIILLQKICCISILGGRALYLFLSIELLSLIFFFIFKTIDVQVVISGGLLKKRSYCCLSFQMMICVSDECLAAWILQLMFVGDDFDSNGIVDDIPTNNG